MLWFLIVVQLTVFNSQSFKKSGDVSHGGPHDHQLRVNDFVTVRGAADDISGRSNSSDLGKSEREIPVVNVHRRKVPRIFRKNASIVQPKLKLEWQRATLRPQQNRFDPPRLGEFLVSAECRLVVVCSMCLKY